ncbi:MAG TPA: EutN/CcmL family microcompartment protein [Polyangia bacterium]|nr:EutN/CcmL family microcompartment protein [Polyangia bacterium]
MFLGKVIGTVWSSVKWPELEGFKLLLVRPYSLGDLGGDRGAAAPAPNHDGVVCADVLGAGIGEDVVIAYGHAARVAVSELLPDGAKPNVPIDAAVVAIVDRFAVTRET